MSLLNSVLGSIGTGNRTPLPKPPDRASTATPPVVVTSSLEPIKPSSATAARLPHQNAHGPLLKRKFEGNPTQRNGGNGGERALPKPNPPVERAKPTAPQSSISSSSKQATASRTPTTPATQPKAPPRGSYLDLMNQAKALQAEKAAAAQHVGMIKHSAAKKERMSKVERRRREEELKTQGKGKTSRISGNGAIKKPALPINGRHRDSGLGNYKGTSRAPASTSTSKDKPVRPKEHEEPSYKGTAGLKKPPPSYRSGGKHRAAKEDRYLDTDEEESLDSFVVDDDEEEEVGAPSRQRRDQGPNRYRYVDEDESDASSDMEAGYDDVEREERRAALQAKKDDEREKALEERLKREKEAKKRAFERGK